jgi:hypothetical protein
MVSPEFVSSVPWRRLLCEPSSKCRYWDLVDISDSLFDGDSTVSMDLKDTDHGADLVDESKDLECSVSYVKAWLSHISKSSPWHVNCNTAEYSVPSCWYDPMRLNGSPWLSISHDCRTYTHMNNYVTSYNIVPVQGVDNARCPGCGSGVSSLYIKALGLNTLRWCHAPAKRHRALWATLWAAPLWATLARE